jgi:hypothetical protein
MITSPFLIGWFYFLAMGFVGIWLMVFVGVDIMGIGIAVRLREWGLMSKPATKCRG